MSRKQEIQDSISKLKAELAYIEGGEMRSERKRELENVVCAPTESQRVSDPIEDIFTFHDNPAATPHYIEIREAAKTFARVVYRHGVAGQDLNGAICCIRQAVMWANASIALNGRGI